LSQPAADRRIAPALFEILWKVTPLIGPLMTIDVSSIRDNVDAQRKYFADLSQVKDALLIFMRSFYKQFFFYGFGIDFDRLDAAAITKIRSIQAGQQAGPKAMVRSAVDFSTNVSQDLPIAGYGGGDRFALKSAYCSSLYSLLQAFNNEGKVMDNYQEISLEAKKYLIQITTTCQASN
jgi:hypothetical protein